MQAIDCAFLSVHVRLRIRTLDAVENGLGKDDTLADRVCLLQRTFLETGLFGALIQRLPRSLRGGKSRSRNQQQCKQGKAFFHDALLDRYDISAMTDGADESGEVPARRSRKLLRIESQPVPGHAQMD